LLARFILQGLCDRHESTPDATRNGLVVLRTAAVPDLGQRLHRSALDKAPKSVPDHAVSNPRARVELLRRRYTLIAQGKHDLDRLLVAEQCGGSAACLSWFVHVSVYRSE
jgi:hypothetical protein